ncbi:TonB-dependent receptor [Hymenobacter sp. UV11]|nr:TonB-dependent receptor [Hymenobacter sp. UV11]
MSIVLIITVFQTVIAQTRAISGRVIDQTSGEGLPGATVLLKGTTTGVSSNSDGRFTLNVPDTGGALVVSSVGMVTQEVSIGNRANFDIALATDNKQLSEVVVLGYGEQVSRRELTGAVATVASSQYKDQPVTGVDQALQGRAAGVQVSQNSGAPGSAISVRVRGAASILASSEPLYVVDGLPISTGNTSQLGTGNQTTNGLSDLNPNDIATIEVLKDAAAAAVYGSRGSNGVVIITTKRGQAGKTQVNLEYYTGASTVWKRPQVINGPQQTQVFLDEISNFYPANTDGTVDALGVRWRSNADLTAYYFGPGDAAASGGVYTYTQPANNFYRPLSQFQDPSTAPTTDWVSPVLRTAPISNYAVTFSGGTDKSRYRLSVNDFNQQGTLVGSGYNRASARLSLDNNLSDKIRMGLSIGLSSAVNNRVNNDNSIYGVLTTARLYSSDLPIFNPDGTYYKNGSLENPIVAANVPLIKSVDNRLLATQYTEFEFIKDLRYRATFSLDYLYERDDSFYSTITNSGASVNGDASAGSVQQPRFNHISAVNYSHTFATDHSLTALAVVEYQRTSYSSIFAEATGFPSNAIQLLSAGANKTDATSFATNSTLFSQLLKLNYAYKGKYLLGGSVRRDNSSNFGADNRIGYFSAVSAGWRVIDESFLKDQTALSELKLRASYGQTGNNNFGTINNADFPAVGLIGGGYNYQGQGGLAPNQLANPALKWENTTNYNIGLDIGTLQNRVYLSADIYKRITNDLLLPYNLPLDTGYPSYNANVGSMENKGLELALTTVNLTGDGDSFGWTTNFNISFNRNKVTAVSDPSPTGVAYGFASRLKVGEPLGSFYGYRVDHIFQTQDEINALNAKSSTGAYQTESTRPGDIKFRDLNGDGVVTAADQEIMGNAQPKYFGGITNTFRYKGIDLNVFFQFNVGNQIYNNPRAYNQGMSSVYGQDVAVLNRWTPTNTNTDMPRAVYGDPNGNARTSDRFLESGSYGRFKTVTLGYNLPADLLSRVHLRTLRLYVQAQNLVTFTKYTGLDPELSTFPGSNTSLGTDFFTYPQARTITGGINVGF